MISGKVYTLRLSQPLARYSSAAVWGKAKLSQPARQLSFAFSKAKLLFSCVKDCNVPRKLTDFCDLSEGLGIVEWDVGAVECLLEWETVGEDGQMLPVNFW